MIHEKFPHGTKERGLVQLLELVKKEKEPIGIELVDGKFAVGFISQLTETELVYRNHHTLYRVKYSRIKNAVF